MTSWYSIRITTTSATIFNGYFSVNNNTNKVISFYETINNNTDFTKNILSNNNYNGADYLFTNKNFTFNGTNINYMNYYSNDARYVYFLLSKFDSRTDIISLSSITGKPISQVVSTFTITLILDPSCFNEGTKILCLNKNLQEEYIPIEKLRKGDIVKCYKHGYRKIDLIGKNPMINNPKKSNEFMYKMKKTKENGLIEDLIVTGGHSILVDDLGVMKEENYKLLGSTQMIDDKYLLVCALSKQFIKLKNTNLYIYYHFILENNGNNDERFGVWANGILTETPSKNQFMNHKYTLL
jgi:hypothetical protein